MEHDASTLAILQVRYISILSQLLALWIATLAILQVRYINILSQLLTLWIATTTILIQWGVALQIPVVTLCLKHACIHLALQLVQYQCTVYSLHQYLTLLCCYHACLVVLVDITVVMLHLCRFVSYFVFHTEYEIQMTTLENGSFSPTDQ